MAAVYSPALVCKWSQWTVVADFHLRLDLPPHNCTDMTGCVGTAKALMPDVVRVETYSGGKPDTLYVKVGDGDDLRAWEAHDLRRLGR